MSSGAHKVFTSSSSGGWGVETALEGSRAKKAKKGDRMEMMGWRRWDREDGTEMMGQR